MELDYEKLGTKIGIEIHQELNTKKLFCDCDSSMNEQDIICEITRKLRAVAGETGEVDLAAQYEHFRDRTFIYHGYKNEACNVECDEEPPHPVNPDALITAIATAKMFNLNIPNTLCVMRKTVTDGSAVSGFQRTILVAAESEKSFLDTSNGRIKINQLNLEEDSCKIERRDADTTYYSLSRLGIPLLEIGTDPSIKNPEHAKEAALLIGTMLRSFKTVRRGLGTIRQDINISIKGGTRIEVKGWQDIRTLPKLVENEVQRQYSLLEIKKELKKRGISRFNKKTEDVSKLFCQTKNKILLQILNNKGRIYLLILPRFSGLLKGELCNGLTLGKELSEYAKAYGTKGIIHSDEDIEKYGLVAEFEGIRKRFKLSKHDLIIIIGEEKNIAEKAANAVYERALYCLKGVPEETRVPHHHNATTSYARPLPGAHRLYPETDIPNMRITKKYLSSVKLPELLPIKIKRLSKKYNIVEHLIKEALKQGIDLEEYVDRYSNINPKQIAEALINAPKEVKKRFGIDIDIQSHADEIFTRLNKKEISYDAVNDILVKLGKGEGVDYSRYRVMSDKEIEKEVREIVEANKSLPVNAVIGKVMAKLRSKADGRKIVELVRKFLQ
ncbi:Glu-tRNA(Gln) amidotransferase subunit GatE [Candidatus Woesearchaeota archaeon]|nr:Glu-tRNA(Gln) amidotransferase subunit GatE [Candidatus Woesearchaeota archaeon]